jgi:hypothetical protein
MSTEADSKDAVPVEPSPLEATTQYVDPVERAIRDAIARGEFDNLPGTGKPLPDVDRQYDPDWWARRHLDEVRAQDAADEARRMIRKELPFLRTMRDQAAAAARIAELNALVAEVNRALSPDDRIAPIV